MGSLLFANTLRLIIIRINKGKEKEEEEEKQRKRNKKEIKWGKFIYNYSNLKVKESKPRNNYCH
jgi:protein subunit release factor B